MIKEEAPPPLPGGGVVGGVPGRNSGGQAGGVIGSIIKRYFQTFRTIHSCNRWCPSGSALAGDNQLVCCCAKWNILPSYRQSGPDSRGCCAEAVTTGTAASRICSWSADIRCWYRRHPAVKQWRYKPYLLNGQPVEVETTITVYFHAHIVREWRITAFMEPRNERSKFYGERTCIPRFCLVDFRPNGLAKCDSAPNAIHFSEAEEFGGLAGRWTPENCCCLHTRPTSFTTTFRGSSTQREVPYTDLEVEVDGTFEKTGWSAPSAKL